MKRESRDTMRARHGRGGRSLGLTLRLLLGFWRPGLLLVSLRLLSFNLLFSCPPVSSPAGVGGAIAVVFCVPAFRRFRRRATAVRWPRESGGDLHVLARHLSIFEILAISGRSENTLGVKGTRLNHRDDCTLGASGVV